MAAPDDSSRPLLHPVRSTPRGRFFRPTRHEFELGQPGSGHRAVYNSRNARKGRYPLREHHHAQLPRATSPPVALRLEYQTGPHRSRLKPNLRADITFWVAFFFEFGSLVWVANGFCVWLPIELAQYESAALTRTADALAFVGGSLFLVGAYLGLLEAANRGMELDFGTEAEELLWGRTLSSASRGDESESTTSKEVDVERRHGRPSKPKWQWLPSPRWRELGYLSAAVQMFAATIFWVPTLTGLPGVIPGFFEGEAGEPIEIVFFWVPQVIGGIGFVVSASILCIEVQTHWWQPKPLSLGWQIGFWNVVGAFGFLLCGALGIASSSGAVYESGLSTFWGSWAFLIGSTFQIYEAIWRDPREDD